jgi:hypothetical protein
LTPQFQIPIYHRTLTTMANSHNHQTFSWEHGPMAILPLPSTATSGSTPRTQAATELTLIHNSLIRALNSIYIQSPHIPLDEYTNFTSYALATYLGLRAHRSSRLFSTLRDARTFETVLIAWGNWLQSIAARRNKFQQPHLPEHDGRFWRSDTHAF